MVPFYDYAFLKIKPSPHLFVSLLTFGCHNNAYGNGSHTLVQSDRDSFLNEINDAYHFIVSGGVGYNFFQPYPQNYHPISPFSPLQKNIFNPKTGEQLKKNRCCF